MLSPFLSLIVGLKYSVAVELSSWPKERVARQPRIKSWVAIVTEKDLFLCSYVKENEWLIIVQTWLVTTGLLIHMAFIWNSSNSKFWASSSWKVTSPPTYSFEMRTVTVIFPETRWTKSPSKTSQRPTFATLEPQRDQPKRASVALTGIGWFEAVPKQHPVGTCRSGSQHKRYWLKHLNFFCPLRYFFLWVY